MLYCAVCVIGGVSVGEYPLILIEFLRGWVRGYQLIKSATSLTKSLLTQPLSHEYDNQIHSLKHVTSHVIVMC